MTKAELAEKIYNEGGLSKKAAVDAVDTVFELMKQALESGDTLKISGFGSFSVRQKADRKGRNPQTGETITITNRQVVTFKLSTVLRDAINQRD